MISSNDVVNLNDVVQYLNALIGVLIVLAVLILIGIIVYVVKIKPNLQASAVKPATYNSSVDNNTDMVTQKIDNEQDNLVDDNELVAVITAAIYASMGTEVPADGLVVRSIRKVNSKKWVNA